MRAVVLLALAGMGARNTFAQSATTAPAPVLTLQLAPPAPPEGRPAVSAKAATAYRRGVAALHKGKNAHAERDARRALRLAPSFAEAWALAATASLGISIDPTSSKTLAESLDKAVVPDKPHINRLVRILTTHCMTQAQYICSGVHSPEQVHTNAW